MKKLPTWNQIDKKQNKGEPLDLLEEFIYNCEPCDKGDTRKFRAHLKRLVNFHFENTEIAHSEQTD